MKKKSSRPSALITGSSKRIGRAICLKLADMGFDIAIHCNHNQKEAVKLSKEVKNRNVNAEIFTCDLTNSRKTKSFIREVKRSFPNLNILINNASIFEANEIKSADVTQLEKHFKIHVEAPFLLTQSFANIYRKGQIINILDTNITKQSTQYFTYLLSKKNLCELTQMSAVALGPYIRVNGIAPGLILPPEKKSTAYLNKRADKIPLKRRGSIENVTQCVQFLIENDFITGQIIFADGGEHLL